MWFLIGLLIGAVSGAAAWELARRRWFSPNPEVTK